MYEIYTDGAYSPKLDIGGIGFVIYKDNKLVCQFNKAYKHTTNQRMEQLACIIALESIINKSEVTLYTDSMYIVGTMAKNWKRKCNLDLWKRLDKIEHTVTFIHIKGHNGNLKNEQADKLATEAIRKYR